MQIKPTAMLTLLFIIILVAHIIVPYFFDAENPPQDASLVAVGVWFRLMRLRRALSKTVGAVSVSP
jgi:hypothetical protein